ncbi:MAG: FprA family A-type flavoprotein [Chlorobi bacterium]|nr:FprA family A-type flavoprotein [Chlorobiota bacterium]
MEKAITLPVTDDITWIGIPDPNLVTFDVVMETKYGTTYNSYFVNADKKTIIETAKENFREIYLEKVRQVTNPGEIKYIILNHTEPDHSGSLKYLLEIAPQATVVGTGNALRYLEDIIGMPFRSMKVKDGDTLDLGNKTLRFIGAPNLHWPDTMYTWIEEDRVLFTCDSFGAHYCDERMFDDLVDNFDEAFTYYFDVILKPYSKFMLKAIGKIDQLDIRIIAPGHGPILRQNWKKYVELSRDYARKYLEVQEHSRPVILIAYVSAYGYTAEMGKSIADGIKDAGQAEVRFLDLEHVSIREMEENLIKADGIIVGSPTINQNTLLPLYKLMSVINPLRDKGKPAAVFGSYGWSGEGPEIIAGMLRSLKLKLADEVQKIRFSPHDATHEKTKLLKDFGKTFFRHLGK